MMGVLVDRFAAQHIVVTGAGSGIGRATALRLASEGAAVACIDLVESSLADTAKLLADAGGSGSSHVCDVSDHEQVGAVVKDIRAGGRAIHALVNVAGIGNLAHSADQPASEWLRIINVNLSGTFFMCQAVIPDLLACQGRIVNMASVAGLIGQPYNAAYCASKGGVIALTKSLAVEYVDKGVLVNAIAPAGIQTPLVTDVAIPDGVDFSKFARLSSPLGMAEPDEVAVLVAYLLSKDSRYMTGSIVTMDGGVSV
jgi:meso-butanediol dehydrogenase / (S,S)-butanediol dehydrogenase / diacetyl reductase